MSDDEPRTDLNGHRIPRPPVSLETEEFWKRAAEGRLAIKRCGGCGKAFWYPRAVCPLCHSSETYWEDSVGTGRIYSYSVVRALPTGPYVLGYVELDEGPLMMTNLVDFSEEALAIGARVKVRFAETGEGAPPAPVFGPE